MKMLNVACLGAGYFSRFHYDAWRRLDGVRLLACCDRDSDKAQQTGLQSFSRLENMLTDVSIDLLDIITPPDTHLQSIRQAIAAGVPVLICQKPFCQSLEEARLAVEEARQADVLLIVHENFRFQPWFRVMRKAIEEEAIGQVQQATFRMRTGDGQGPDAYLDRQPYFQSMKRFLIHETGVHYIDAFRYLFGEPEAVYADLRRLNPVIAGEDAGYFLFDFPGQLRALYDGNRHLDFNASDTRLTFGESLIEGTRGSLILTGDGRVSKRTFGSNTSQVVLQPVEWPGFAGDCVYALQHHVIEHLLHGGELENTAEEYLKTMHLEHLVYDSAVQGRKLRIQ